MEDDRALVEAVLAGKPRAFEQFVNRFQRLVWHLVYRMVGHADDTEELAQDVFMRAHRYLPQFRFESALSTWIGQIAFSVASRHLEKKRLPTTSIDDDDGQQSWSERLGDDSDLEAAMVSTDLSARVNAALHSLPPLQRTLVSMYYLEEQSVGDIAAIVGIPEGTAKNYLFRARSALRKRLEAELGVV